jgi:hypothetical protein
MTAHASQPPDTGTTLWLLDVPAPGALPPICARGGATSWRARDGRRTRWYLALPPGALVPGAPWTLLQPLLSIAGAARGETATVHYTVEADVASQHERDFNAWYDQEHLPGLAAVPGTVHAARHRRAAGSPRYLACYDLVSPQVLEHPQWLAVRHTAWSARVRPLFIAPRRTMFAPAR